MTKYTYAFHMIHMLQQTLDDGLSIAVERLSTDNGTPTEQQVQESLFDLLDIHGIVNACIKDIETYKER